MAELQTTARVERQFIDEQHRRLRAGLAAVEETLADAHDLDRAILADRLLRTLEWLRRDVLPLDAWEDAWLFPAVDRAAGTPFATAALRLEHGQIAEACRLLEADTQVIRERWSRQVELQVVVRLATIDALVSAHLLQEERLILPLLERASDPVAS
jgi:hypothetical protein